MKRQRNSALVWWLLVCPFLILRLLAGEQPAIAGPSPMRPLLLALAGAFLGSFILFGLIAFVFGISAMSLPCRQKLAALRWRVVGTLGMGLSYGAGGAAWEFSDKLDFPHNLTVLLVVSVVIGFFTTECGQALLRIQRINRRLWGQDLHGEPTETERNP